MPRLFLICSSVILFYTLSVQGYADEHFPFLGEVSKESVNVRAGANTNFEKIDKLSHGDQVVVLGHQYEWYKIQLPTTAKAFIRADYVQMKEGSIAVVIGDKVNVRALANSDAASLGQITKGRFVKVLEQANGWCRIEGSAGTVAWVHQDFVIMKSPIVPTDMIAQELQFEPTAHLHQ